MTSLIQHYRSLTAGNVPASLAAGRLGINHTDGMLFYRDSTGAVAKRFLRDYSIVIAKGEVGTAVASLTFDITPVTIGIMRGFVLRIGNAVPVTSNANLMMRFGDASSIKTGTDTYRWHYFTQSVTTDHSGSDSADVWLSLVNIDGTSNPVDSEVLISTNDPTPTQFRHAAWRTVFRIASGNITHLAGGGWYMNDIDITRIQLLYDSGNISKMKYSLTGLL